MKERKLTIIETSDVHTYISSQSFKERGDFENFSLSKVKTYLDNIRKTEELVIYIDNGDTIQGSPLGNFYKDKKDPANLMKVYENMDLDAWVLGNHDFNYGRDYLKSAIENIRVPVLCGNLIDHSNKNKIGHQAYVVKDYPGLRVGILGLITKYIPHWESATNIKDFEFLSPIETAKKYIPILKEKEKCDLVIVSYHGGFEKDLETGLPIENLTGENEGYGLLDTNLDMDVLLTGHQHRIMKDKFKNIPILQPGFGASHLGRVDIILDEQNKVLSSDSHLVETKDLAVNEEIENFLKEDMVLVQDFLDKKAGEISPSARIENVLYAQVMGHSYINLLNQIQIDTSGADVGAISIYKNDANGFGTEVTMRDIMRNYPYSNTLTRVRILGSELKKILEHNSNYFCLNEKGDLVVNPDYIYPKNQIYNYDIFSGISYEYDYSKPLGQRLVKVEFRGRELDDNEEITLATNSYRGKGGGNFPVLDGSQIEWESNQEMPQIIYDYTKGKEKIEIRDFDSVNIKSYKEIVY